MRPRLYRSRKDVRIGGVAAGTAEWLDWDPSLVRVGWVIGAFVTGGLLLLVYIVMWVVVPVRPRKGAKGSAASAAAAAATPGEESGERAELVDDENDAAANGPNDPGSGALVLGGILIAVGIVFLARELLPPIDFGRFWPIVVIVAGAAIVIAALRPGARS